MGGEEEVEALQIRCKKWVIGLKRGTPNYVVMHEGGANLMRAEAGRRAVKFEERMRNRNGVLGSGGGRGGWSLEE